MIVMIISLKAHGQALAPVNILPGVIQPSTHHSYMLCFIDNYWAEHTLAGQ